MALSRYLVALGIVGLLLSSCGRSGFDVFGEPSPSACIESVELGLEHGCAVRTDDTVWCWGNNARGAFGAISDEVFPAPFRIEDTPKGIVELSVGESFSCVRTKDNGVYCWGQNSDGQLGNGNTGTASAPTRAQLPDDVVSIEAASHHACAIVGGDSLICWGDNADGQLGDGTTEESRALPEAVSGLSNVPDGIRAVHGGHDHTCALKGDGTMWCWGANEAGQLGDGSGVGQLEPVQVAGLSDVDNFDCARSHCCAATSEGAVSCWGYGESGQLGNGMSVSRDTPVKVTLPGPARLVGVGDHHSCTILKDERVFCWGANSKGRLGNSTLTSSSRPNEIPDFLATPGSVLDMGADTTVLSKPKKTALVWGSNEFGEYGNGTRSIQVSPFPIDTSARFTSVDTGWYHSCAIGDDSLVYCWGANEYGQAGRGDKEDVSAPSVVAGIQDIDLIATGNNHTCVHTLQNEIYCWGSNSDGQSGLRATTSSPLPILFENSLRELQEMVAGDDFTCALTPTGDVYCWGDSAIIGAGDGPRAIDLPEGATDITAGGTHACAVLQSGAVSCWGVNLKGQLGDNTIESRSTAAAVDFTGIAVEVAAGAQHTCLRTDTNDVFCWGDADYGQLGDGQSGSSSTDILVPTQVAGLSDASLLRAGRRSTCVASAAGEPQCFGQNSYGHLANGSLEPRLEPGPSEYENVADFAMGVDHMCVLNVDGFIECSGRKRRGATGEGLPLISQPRPIFGLDCP